MTMEPRYEVLELDEFKSVFDKLVNRLISS